MGHATVVPQEAGVNRDATPPDSQEAAERAYRLTGLPGVPVRE